MKMKSTKRSADDGWSNDREPGSKLVSVRKADVPEYLHQSEFYQSLDNSNEEILVPGNCLKLDDEVACGEDLHWLLQTLRFWIADPTIESVLKYVFSKPLEVVEPIIREFYREFPVLKGIEDIRLGGNDLNSAVYSKVLPFVKYLRENMACCWHSNSCGYIALMGNVEMLKYALKTGGALLGTECESAARGGHLPCLRYLREELKCPWDENITHQAVLNGNVACLRYAFENGCPRHGIRECTTAAKYNRLNCLQLLHEYGCPWGTETCEMAMRQVNIDILLYLLKNGCPVCDNLWSLDSTSAFADVVQCFLDKGLTWELTPDATLGCIQKENFQGLKVLIQNGCPWHPLSFAYAVTKRNFDLFKLVHELGAPWQKDTCMRLAYSGLIDWLPYAHTHGAAISPETCEVIMQHGQWSPKLVECFKYAHQFGGCELRREYAKFAVHDGGPELWSYLKSQGCGCVLW